MSTEQKGELMLIASCLSEMRGKAKNEYQIIYFLQLEARLLKIIASQTNDK
jgi:hypothetical protein